MPRATAEAFFGGGGPVCDYQCVMQKAADKIWKNFSDTAPSAGASSGLIPQPFGGRIIFPLPCLGGWAFTLMPSAGSPGPYFVSALPGANGLKSFYSVWPGNNVLGTSIPGGVCVIIVGGIPFTFDVEQTVTLVPGMGTSLSPGL